MITKSNPFKNEKGPLIYLVGTPIGNMGDVSSRAIEVLKSADIIASEDTRNTAHLLTGLGIKAKKLFPCYAQNERVSAIKLVEEVKNEGLVLCYMSDAGNPGISDPGSILVSIAIENDVPVSAVLGPSAFIHALIVSGFDTSDFSFYGFLPVKENARQQSLEELVSRKETLIFYESPHRITKTLATMSKVFGTKRRAVACRELTKMYEEVIRGELGELSTDFPESSLRGEFVIIVEGNKEEKVISKEDIVQALNDAYKAGLTVKEAVMKVAEELKVKKNEVYRLANEK